MGIVTHHLVMVTFVVIFVLALFAIRIVQQYEQGVVIRFGEAVGERSAGLRLVIPFIETVVKLDMRVKPLSLKNQSVITRDNVSLSVKVVVFYKIVDATLNYTTLANDADAIKQQAQAIMRAAIGKHDLADLLGNSDNIANSIKAELEIRARDWGIEITQLELQDIGLPESMQRAMASVAESTREAEAKVVAAQGELNSAQLLRQAADLMTPEALELRRLQTWREIGMDQGTLIVVASDGNTQTANNAAAAAAGSMASSSD